MLFERFGGYAVVEVGFTSVSNRNPSKVVFCPKEVKSILEFEVLLQKYVHSHTIRKIIVFASLNITHGSEDKNELFLNQTCVHSLYIYLQRGQCSHQSVVVCIYGRLMFLKEFVS